MKEGEKTKEDTKSEKRKGSTPWCSEAGHGPAVVGNARQPSEGPQVEEVHNRNPCLESPGEDSGREFLLK